MIWVSALLVFGAFAVIGVNLGAEDSELHLGFQQMIHARTPWLLLGPLWGGVALGVASMVRRRPWVKLPVVGVELVLSAAVTWYVASFSFLPADRALSLEVGDPFPAYALSDQDGALRTHDAANPGEAALYIFYRGDW